MSNGKDLLTYSRLSTRRLCPKQDYYKYEIGLRRESVASALRMGGAFALGKELWRKHCGDDDAATSAINDATEGYLTVPQWADSYDWEIECETVRAMLAGYFWRYADDVMQFLGIEESFAMPLVNPASGRSSQTFMLAGKIDGVIKMPDGRIAVYEDKTTSANIDDDSDYWLRLRYDGQISQYVLGARYLGYDASLVLYDVTRKPTIKPRSVPVLDENGMKIVRDSVGERVFRENIKKNGEPGAHHGEPIQSASKDKGHTLATRRESPEEWGERLLADIGARPKWYFARREIPRLEGDLEEFRAEIWQQSQLLRECRKNNWWFRNVAFNTCGHCEYKHLCLNGIEVDPRHPPTGFVVMDDVHPELLPDE